MRGSLVFHYHKTPFLHNFKFLENQSPVFNHLHDQIKGFSKKLRSGAAKALIFSNRYNKAQCRGLDGPLHGQHGMDQHLLCRSHTGYCRCLGSHFTVGRQWSPGFLLHGCQRAAASLVCMLQKQLSSTAYFSVSKQDAFSPILNMNSVQCHNWTENGPDSGNLINIFTEQLFLFYMLKFFLKSPKKKYPQKLTLAY